MKRTVNFKIGDEQLEITGDYTPAEIGSMEDPPSPHDFLMEEVIWYKKDGESGTIFIDVTDLILAMDEGSVLIPIETEILDSL